MKKLIYISVVAVVVFVVVMIAKSFSELADFAAMSLVIASFDGWLLTLGYKWRVIEWLQSHAPCDLVWQMFDCQYCLSWWSGLLLSIVAAAIFGCWWFVLCAFVSTKITQWLIR